MQTRCAFTLVELVACLAGSAVVLAVTAGLIGQPAGNGSGVRPGDVIKKDQTQIRGITQAFIVWAQNNGDRYPLPSEIDKGDTTVAERGAAKNTSANIMSLLVYNGFVPVEMLVSPGERSPGIRACEVYAFDRPPSAVEPGKALWDPALNADFTGGKTGNLSYAHLQPSGKRKGRWGNTFVSDEAVVSGRGPEVASVLQNADGSVTPALANPASLALGWFGGAADGWSGNTGYNDNHVGFHKDTLRPGLSIAPTPTGRKYAGAQAKEWPDVWCYDEPDDPDSTNDFLGIFIKAGGAPKDFKAIWD
ncbi:MAG: hypothetical protein IT437_01990 [Phycisphaerales bacterium]|nr:hypothetical protein [Phycisphaerales bacterium]